MTDDVKWDGLNQNLADLKRKLFAFGEAIGKGAFDRFESGVLNKTDSDELKHGTEHVLAGLDALVKDADLLISIAPEYLPIVIRMVGHARSLICGSLLVAKHLEITETARLLTRKQQTEAANQGNIGKRDERLEFLRPLLMQAQRNGNGNFVKVTDLLKQVNKFLKNASNSNGTPKSEDIESVQTLRRYGNALKKVTR